MEREVTVKTMTVVDDVPAGLQRESADSGTVERGREARDTPCLPPWNRHVLADAANAMLQERLWCDRNDAVDTPDEPQRGEQTPDVSADMQEARPAENCHSRASNAQATQPANGSSRQ